MFSKVVLYARFSASGQRHGTSLIRQLGDMRAAVANDTSLAGLPLIEISDDGRSGYHGEHRSIGAFGRFEQEALRGEHHGSLVIVEKLDRLSRQGHEATHDLIRSLTAQGVTIRTLDGDLYEAGESITLMQVITGSVKADVARIESKNKADRTAANWRIKREVAKATKTAVTSLIEPWLIVNEDRTISLDAYRSALVLRWFEMADAGAGSKTIADTLDREGEPTWPRFEGRAPKRWNRTFIAKTLRNRAVLGEFTPKVQGVAQEPWPDYFPVCVAADLFARVNNAAPIRKIASAGLRSEKVVNLVSGLAECKLCGSKLRYSKGRSEGARWTNPQGKTYSYRRDCGSLVCPLGEVGKCANRRYLAYLTFEDALLDSCLHLALDDEAFANRGEVARLNATIAERERAHELASEAFKNLSYAWAERPTPPRKQLADEAEAKLESVAANLQALREQRDDACGRADSAAHLRRVGDVRAALYHPDLADRVPVRKKVKQALRALIHRMVYDGDGVSVRFIADAALLRFDRKGRLTGTFDLVKDGRSVPPELEAYARRRRAAKGNGVLFKSAEAR